MIVGRRSPCDMELKVKRAYNITNHTTNTDKNMYIILIQEATLTTLESKRFIVTSESEVKIADMHYTIVFIFSSKSGLSIPALLLVWELFVLVFPICIRVGFHCMTQGILQHKNKILILLLVYHCQIIIKLKKK